MSSDRGIPRKDGSGKGTRDNRGRGGCRDTRKTGRGLNSGGSGSSSKKD